MIDYAAVVKKILSSGRYPAIIFLFSRRLVEEQALATADRLALVEEEAKREIRERVAEAASPSALKLHGTLFKCLESGVGYHHAGLLPSAKRLVEELFVGGLLPVVFCTETFALGVNYPARAVAIGQVTKRDDSGYRPLKAREILQMAGRAGRRGQDKKGYVYFCIDPNYPEEAPSRAPDVPEPVIPSSEYTPEGVIRIIAGLGSDRDILKKYATKSFAAYAAETTKKRAQEELTAARESLDRHMAAEGCTGFERCLAAWNECFSMRSEIGRLERDIGQARKLLKKARKKRKQREIKRREAAVLEYQEEMARRKAEMDAVLSRGAGCSRGGPGSCTVFARFKKALKEHDRLCKRYEALPDALRAGWTYFENVAQCLVDAGYLSPEWELTEKGQLARDASAGGVLLAEILDRVAKKGLLGSMPPETLAGLAAGCLCEFEDCCTAADGIEGDALCYLRGRGIDRYYSGAMQSAVQSWAAGKSIEKCAAKMDAGPGDFVLLARRAAEVLRSLARGESCSALLRQKAGDAYKLVWKDEVAEVF